MAPKPKQTGSNDGSCQEKEDSFANNVSDNSKIIKRKKKNGNSYSLYVHKILKQIHPEIGISNKAVNTIDSLVNDILDQIATEASRLVKHSKKSTITSKDIQAAVKLVLPGELSKHAENEANKALTNFADKTDD